MPHEAMKLTAELVQRVRCPMTHSGPQDGMTYLTEADYDQNAEGSLTEHPAGEDI